MIVENKYYLVHNDSEVILKGGPHTGEISTIRDIEVFNTEVEMEDRITTLGLIDIVSELEDE